MIHLFKESEKNENEENKTKLQAKEYFRYTLFDLFIGKSHTECYVSLYEASAATA